MNSQRRKHLLWAIFGLALLGAIWGWLWVVLRLVRNEAEVSENRLREVEERYFSKIEERFRKAQPELSSQVSDVLVKEIALAGTVAGVWSENFTSSDADSAPGAWFEEEPQSSEQLKALNPRWGHVIDGRDLLGALILKIARKERDGSPLRELLEEGVWKYDGSPMTPGFRLLLIRALEKMAPSEALMRLKTAERIRAVEGNVSQLTGEDFEAIEVEGVTWYFTKDQLEARLNEEGVQLTAEPPEDRGWTQVVGLRRWPYLSRSNGGAPRLTAEGVSKATLGWVGALTGITVLGLILGAGLVGHRELKQARARTDLAASVAHELRTPLAGQRVILESLLQRCDSEQEYLSMALRENQRLGDLAEEFLTFSRLERGVLDIQLRSCDLGAVLGQVVNGFRQQWSDGELLFSDTSEPTLTIADESGVATIVRNLIENAWKYSDSPRRIEVELLDNDKEAGFAVSDNGIGLSQKNQEQIFKQFYRVDRKLSRAQDGLGLGLSIVKRLTEAMNARLEVESELGKGSSFKVWFQKEGGGEA